MTNRTNGINKILVLGVVLIVGLTIYIVGTSKQALAQGLVERIINLIKGTYEEGFRMVEGENQRFLYARETPNYLAYTGNKADYGSHIVRLEKDGRAIEYSFLEVRKVYPAQAANSSTSGDTSEVSVDFTSEVKEEVSLGGSDKATDSADLSEEQKAIVEEWQQQLEEIQEDLATISGEIKGVEAEVSEIEKAVREAIITTQMTEGPIIEKIVKYENLVANTDIFNQLLPQGIREEIILKELSSPQPLQALSFVFEIDPLGLSYEDVGNGVWYFYDETGEAWFRLPRTYAIDSNKKFTNNVFTQITQEEIEGETKTLLIVTIDDPEWLNNPERQFPITIFNALELVPDKRGEYAPEVPSSFVPATPSVILNQEKEATTGGEASPSAEGETEQ